jgi:hypothetical protein
VLLAPLKLAAAIVLTLLGLLLAAWVVDAVMVCHVWPEGLERLEGVLAGDLERAGQLARWCEACAGLPARTARLFYGLLFEVTSLHEIGARFADGAALSVPDTIVRRTATAPASTGRWWRSAWPSRCAASAMPTSRRR